MHRLQDAGRNQGKTIGLNLSGSTGYVGRFAPSPTGRLHLGSLYTALISFMDARRHQGRWLLRIDDLDTPRNMPGATSDILKCLEAFGLCWDGEVYYQSRHLQDYANAIERLQSLDLLYPCNCSRKQLQNFGDIYPGICRSQPSGSGDHAWRIKTEPIEIGFYDRCQGQFSENLAGQHGDFVIKRRDGVIAYQLAVVIDDHVQQVNQVVRGYDLLDSTAKQIFLQQQLDYATPGYLHAPVIVDKLGNKLSKQTCALPVESKQPAATLFRLLNLMKQYPPAALQRAASDEILDWAVRHWQAENLNRIQAIEQIVD